MTPTVTIDGREMPFTLRVLPLLLASLPTAELNALRWSECVRRELVSRHRNPATPNVPEDAVPVAARA